MLTNVFRLSSYVVAKMLLVGLCSTQQSKMRGCMAHSVTSIQILQILKTVQVIRSHTAVKNPLGIGV